ncbi:hypothetical protein B296_00038175 [Ensete ventricosum]|uniref:Uncharacterized protein n=1 Tax=Ensete ventricosum TaxID=4639 RepID=A0A426ZGB6_ENSVE|nr:hypothetical protein B296_00038175 [Ensete ventricosum]
MIASFPTPLRLRSPFRCPRPLFPRDDGGRRRRGWASRSSMCLAAAPFVKDGALRVNGREALTSVPQNVVVSPPLMDGAAAFLGAVADREDSRHVFKLGVLRDFRLLCLFRYVYVWHALMGYWGGVSPDAAETKKYNSKLVYPVQSPGNLSHSRDLTMDCMEKYGVGMVDPDKAFDFYDDLHSYLRSQNIDGVKVDVQNILETIGTGHGGRVSLAHRFHGALEKSIAKNFQDNRTWPCLKVPSIPSSEVTYLTAHVSPGDVEYLEEVAGDDWTGDCAVYSYHDGKYH